MDHAMRRYVRASGTLAARLDRAELDIVSSSPQCMLQ